MKNGDADLTVLFNVGMVDVCQESEDIDQYNIFKTSKQSTSTHFNTGGLSGYSVGK